jgi:hypothetical protein
LPSRVGGSDQGSQRLLTICRNLGEGRPEFFLQRDTGAMAGEREAALDEPAQPPPPGRASQRWSAARIDAAISLTGNFPILTGPS